jgi:hypothetical protein
VKPLLVILAVALALPVSAFARPADMRNDPQVTSGSPGATVQRQDLRNSDRQGLGVRQAPVQARGTDVAAPDQQSPIPPASVRVTAPRGDGFDWASASIGAAVAIVLLAAMLGMTAVLRRRRHTSVAAF